MCLLVNNYYPYSGRKLYRNYPVQTIQPVQYGTDERFLFPFLVGGVAGTALGYGIANNNNSRPPVYYYPTYYYPPYMGPAVPYYR